MKNLLTSVVVRDAPMACEKQGAGNELQDGLVAYVHCYKAGSAL